MAYPCLLPLTKFNSFNLNGTNVSVQLDLLVGGSFPVAVEGKIGAILVRPQKSPDPESFQGEETKERKRQYRREAARFMLVIAAMMLANSGVQRAQLDTKKFAVWDLRLKEAISYPSDAVSRQKQISAAASQISRLWPTVQPSISDLRKP
jgi:hypothetical protein